MPALLLGLMGWILLRSSTAMGAALAACRLFVSSVMPGLLPYMALSLMLASRVDGRMPDWALMLLGWCGGSPTGARLLAQQDRRDKRLALRCATMSPMFLLGTLSNWLNSTPAGVCILASVLAGGWLTGLLVQGSHEGHRSPALLLGFGQAVAAAAQTLLTVCGIMAVLRVLAALLEELLPGLALPIYTLLEVTTGVHMLAQIPFPLPLRTALAAGATGMGGAAVLLQNRACYPPGLFSLWEQILYQALHGLLSFVLALGLMLLWP